MAIHFQEGQFVKKGDPLLDLDDRQYQATLLQAQGHARKRSERASQGPDPTPPATRPRSPATPVSKQILDDQQKLVNQDQGQVKNDQGLVQYDQVQVDYCHIVAPFTGRVGPTAGGPGQPRHGGQQRDPAGRRHPVAADHVWSSRSPKTTLGGVQEQLAQGAKLGVEAFDRTAQTKLAAGEVLALDNQIDTTTGTVKVRAIFPNDDLRLFPNQFVNTRLLVKTLQGATLIPSSAIQQNGQTAFVYVLQDGVVHQRTIKPGVADQGETAVEGINPGDKIADSSFDKLEDGDKVNVREAGGGDGGHSHGGNGPHGDGKPDGSGTPGNRQGGHGGHRQGGGNGGGNGGGGSGT